MNGHGTSNICLPIFTKFVGFNIGYLESLELCFARVGTMKSSMMATNSVITRVEVGIWGG